MALLYTTFAQTMRRLLRAGLAGLLIAGAPLQAWGQQTVTPSSRVTRNVVVRAAPSTGALSIERLAPGQALPLAGEAPGWYRVRLPNGQEGFVSKAWTEPSSAPLVSDDRTYKVHVIDVGTGLAVFVEGADFSLLYDAGSQDDLADGPDNRVVAYIKAVRPTLSVIDHVILSHPHKDHLELMPEVFDAFQIKHVWESGRVNPTAGYCKFLQKVVAERATYHDAIASNSVRNVAFKGKHCIGGVRLATGPMMTAEPIRLGQKAQVTLLHRDAHAYTDPNGNSVVARLDLGDQRILLAGDAEGGDRPTSKDTAVREAWARTAPPQARSIEAELIAECCRAALAADVLVVGHHGSLTSSRAAFLDAVGAKLFVISSGPYPYHKVVLPDPEMVKALEARGAVYRTDLDDDTCPAEPAKPGADADESPGGCNNVVITVMPGAEPAISYLKPAD